LKPEYKKNSDKHRRIIEAARSLVAASQTAS
jgi:hypothetical protein